MVIEKKETFNIICLIFDILKCILLQIIKLKIYVDIQKLKGGKSITITAGTKDFE